MLIVSVFQLASLLVGFVSYLSVLLAGQVRSWSSTFQDLQPAGTSPEAVTTSLSAAMLSFTFSANVAMSSVGDEWNRKISVLVEPGGVCVGKF